MKILTFFLLASLIFIHLEIEALLPPLYQTSSEIKAILTSEELGKKLHSGEVIEKIEKNNQGYEITTNKNHLQVNLVYELAQQPGPKHYTLYFDNAIPVSP